jgi:photosystem II stability/assembly factor-like uncharacterized protein
MTRSARLSRRDWLRLSAAGVAGSSFSGWLENVAAGQQPLKPERMGQRKEHLDEFIGAEIDLQRSLYFGSKGISAARLRMKAVERMLPAGDAVPGGANWVQMGPQAIPNGQSLGGGTRILVTGRVTGIAVHPTTPSTIYVSGARGGVWKTTDGGATWTAKSDNEVSLAIGALAMAPSAPDTLYVGTGEGNIYYLVTALPLSALNESYQGSGVLKTSNGGDSWTLQGASQFTGAAFYGIAVHPTNPDIAYAATTAGLFRTTNGGTSWSLIGGGLPAISAAVIAATSIVFDPTNGDHAWVAFWGSGIYECSNATAASPAWSLVNGGPTTNLSRISLAISRASPSTVYALAADGATIYKGVYRTTGGIGGAWAQLTYSGGTPTVTSSRCIIAVDISTPDIVYFGGTSLHKLVRNAMTNTWSANDIGQNIHADNRTFATHPTDHLTIFAGTDGGVYNSTDGGANWSDQINKAMCITQFEFLDGHSTVSAYVFSGTQDNGTDQYRTGEVFYHAADGDGAAVAVDKNDPRNVMIEHFSISPERSTQAGKFGTFGSISGGLAGNSLFYPPMTLDQANQNRIAFGCDRLFLDPSQGTGGWATQINLPGIGGLVSAIAYVNDNLIYATTSSGEVYRVVNAAGWSATAIHAAPLPVRWIWDIVVNPMNPNLITVALGGFGTGHVWRGTVNAMGTAAVWTNLSGAGGTSLPDAPVNALTLDTMNPTHLYAGTDVGVFRSLDDGGTWNSYREGLPNVAVYDLKIQNSTRLLRAAAHGRGMWEREIDSMTSPDSVIYVRDNVMHTGRGTPPSGVASAIEDLTQHVALNDLIYWYQCADVKIDAQEGSPPSYQMAVSGVDFVAYEATVTHRDPQRGRTNRVYVQVHNRGIQAANVTVKILYADATAQLPDLPADFWTAFPGNTANINVWTPIGNAQTVNVKAGLPSVLEWDWIPPMTTAQHSCVLVVCDSVADPIPAANKVFTIATLVTSERHVGLKNLHVVDPPPADGADTLVMQYQIRTEGRGEIVRLYSSRLRDWSVGLVLPTKVAALVRSPTEPVPVPAEILNEILNVSERDGGLLKDSKLLQFKSLDKPVDLTGFPVSKKPFPAYLVLTRNQQKAAGGALNIVQFAGQRVLGGNTFVIRTPRRVAGREQRT